MWHSFHKFMCIRDKQYEIIQKIGPKVTKSSNHYIYNGELDQNSDNLQKGGIFSKNANSV